MENEYKQALEAVRDAEFQAQEIGWASLSPEIRCAAYRVAEAHNHAWARAFQDDKQDDDGECTREGWVMDATLAEIREDILAAGPGPCGYGIAYPEIGPSDQIKERTPAYWLVTGTGRTEIQIFHDPHCYMDVATIKICRPDGSFVWGKFDLNRADYAPQHGPVEYPNGGAWYSRHAEAWQWAYRAIFPAAIEDMPFPASVLPDEETFEAAA